MVFCFTYFGVLCYNSPYRIDMGFFTKKKKEEVKPEKTEDEIVKEKLQIISDNARIEKEEAMGAIFQDPSSIVCFINDDMPRERQIVHTTETVADYVLHFSNSNILQDWHKRQRNTGKKRNLP